MSNSPDNRLTQRLAELRSRGELALAPYVTAGDGGLERTAAVLRACDQAGAGCIELGMPFSDPSADGPVLRAAAGRSLARGTRWDDVVGLGPELRSAGGQVPLCLFTYAGPLFAVGPERAVAQLRDAGFDGLLVPDLPVEELEPIARLAHAANLCLIPFAAPGSGPVRVAAATELGSGFLYAIPRAGVTGQASGLGDGVLRQLADVRAASRLPIGVGFGISTHSQVAALQGVAELAICGTEFVSRLHAAGPDPLHAAQAAQDFLNELRGHVPSPNPTS